MKKPLKVIYLIFLVIMFFFVRRVLDQDVFDAVDIKDNKKSVYMENMSPKLDVYASDQTNSYTIEVKNIDSVEDFLSELRDKTDFYYEKEMYSYGVEIESVYGQLPQPGYRWALLYINTDITSNIASIPVSKNPPYVLKQMEITRTLEQ